MSALPTVSVVVPCHRYAHLLEGCVASVLAQEGVAVEVLVVDDCSPDDTPAVAARLCAADARVTARRHAVNQGLIATANEGLAWARGDYVVLLSADDLLVPGALREATRVMEAHPRVGLVYGRTALARTGRPLPRPSERRRGVRVRGGQAWIARRCRTAQNCISSPEAVVRTAVQRAVGGYDPACYHTSDLQMWLRVAAVADVAFVDRVQAVYRVHADSMLRSDAGPLVDLRSRRDAFERFFAGRPALADAAGLEARARRALARQALWRASRATDRGGEPELVAELVAFALAVCPGARRLPEWHGLRLRRRIGAGRSGWFPPFLATGAAHRLAGQARTVRLRTRGE